jgi:hypothetical protein
MPSVGIDGPCARLSRLATTDPAELDEAWAAGSALTIEQAAAEILQT